MSGWEKGLMELALDAVEKIGCKCEGVRDAFKTRARSLIADMYSSGVAYVISVAAARSNASAIEVGLTASSLDDVVKMCEDRGYSKNLGLRRDEEFGYALYGALILYSLKRLNVISASRLSDALKSLMGNVVAERVALQAATWLKRFAEAYIP